MLARHTTVELTIGRYPHANLFDLGQAVQRNEALPLDDSCAVQEETTERQKTGTRRIYKPTHKLGSEPLRSVPFDSDKRDGKTENPAKVNVKKNAKTPGKPVSKALSGSGWESNPPNHFSVLSMGLKPRAVTRSAYTPRRGNSMLEVSSSEVNSVCSVENC